MNHQDRNLFSPHLVELKVCTRHAHWVVPLGVP